MKRILYALVAVVAVGVALYKFAMYPGEKFEIRLPKISK